MKARINLDLSFISLIHFYFIGIYLKIKGFEIFSKPFSSQVPKSILTKDLFNETHQRTTSNVVTAITDPVVVDMGQTTIVGVTTVEPVGDLK